MTPGIIRRPCGRWCVVVPGRRVYGMYRTHAMALYRATQVEASSRHKPKEKS